MFPSNVSMDSESDEVIVKLEVKEIECNLLKKFVWMDSRTRVGRDGEKTSHTKSCKGEKVVESHYRPCPEETQHTEN